jgi:DNA excision repair protein ERCC-5
MTAPMEAEAQCAALAQLNLVDGIITDDSDVFLFGGKQCFKNLFNDFKYAECYVLSDLDKELCLTQDRLVTLAFLLGSDYTAGVPGVGYVTAMEILAEFPEKGDEGLLKFREWWMKVQTGKDTEEETDSKWKKSFVSPVSISLCSQLVR